MKAIKRLSVRTVIPESLAGLHDLSLNLRWSWHEPTAALFADIDAQIWQATHDPMQVLAQVSASRMEQLSADPAFQKRVSDLADDLANYLATPRWYQSLADAPSAIAYFSAEYGVTEALPQYSGGLGILAGDHLKSASDTGTPIVAVGLFYRSGYFRQSLSGDGWQLERYPVHDPDGLPLSLLRESDNSPALVSLSLPGERKLQAQIWIAQIGRVPLLLLDTNIEINSVDDRNVTDRLYGGTEVHRLEQELLLGVGGVRAIRSFCRITGHSAPEVFHCNEGHAGFLSIERIRELIASTGLPFGEALEAVRAGTVFTTHTPVPAGIDRFPATLIEQHFGGAQEFPGVPVAEVLALGAEDFAGGDPSVFNMAVMGLRLGGRANGVSQLHGHVSSEMFNGLWPSFDSAEVPITSITNGVHSPTWISPVLWDLAVAQDSSALVDEGAGLQALGQVSDAALWSAKRTMRENLVADVRARLRASWITRGAAPAELEWIDSVFSPDVLTIGFARRVPSYKRLTLMLRDPARLRSILLDPQRPVQLVVAGKSHPADDGGKQLIQKLVKFADENDVRHRIVFLPDYDMGMASLMYPGCDVWLNNPLRPLEACGTSGMKAALNGALNLSILDGWWDEWFDGQNGWAIPSADGVDSHERRDDLEAAALYNLLETRVAPLFYDRNADGLPVSWIAQMKHTLTTLGPKVLASRMVHDYVNQLYTPAALASRKVNGANLNRASELASWKRHIKSTWSGVVVEHVESVGMSDTPQVGDQLVVNAFVALGQLALSDVQVQVKFGVADALDEILFPQTAAMSVVETYEGNRYKFEVTVPLSTSGAFGYTVRVVPSHELLASDAELGLQRLANS